VSDPRNDHSVDIADDDPPANSCECGSIFLTPADLIAHVRAVHSRSRAELNDAKRQLAGCPLGNPDHRDGCYCTGPTPEYVPLDRNIHPGLYH